MSARTRRWRKWLLRGVVGLVVARLLLAVLLLPLANFAAGFAGLTLTWRSASLSLLGLSFRAEDLEVGMLDDGGPALFRAQDLVVDASMRQLLHGEVSIVDAALSGARLHLQRLADGNLRLPPAWQQPAPAAVAPPTPPTGPFSFQLPLSIASARLHDVGIDYEDATTTPGTRYEATIDLDACDLGYADRPGAVLVRLRAPAVLDAAEVSAQLQTTSTHLDLTWHASVRGVRTDTPHLPEGLRAHLREWRLLGTEWRGSVTGDVDAAMPTTPMFRGELSANLTLDGHEHLLVTARADQPTIDNGELDQPFAIDVHCIDLVDSLRVEAGHLHLGAKGSSVRGSLVAQALTLRRLQTLLASAGITMPDHGINLRGQCSAEFGDAMSLRLDELTLDAAGTSTTLSQVAVRNLRQDGEVLAIDSCQIEGPELTLHRAADGALVFAGVRFAPAATNTPLATPAASPAPAPFSLPQLRLGTFTWQHASCTFVDESLPTAPTLSLQDITVQVDALALGLDAPPARCIATARVPDSIGGLRLEARLTPKPDAIDLELQGNADGVTAKGVAPWLSASGITPMLADGKLQFAAGVKIQGTADGLRADVTLANVRLTDGDVMHVRLRSVTGTDLKVGATTVDLGQWTVQDPFAAVHHPDPSTWEVAGLRFAPVATTASAAMPPAAPAAVGPSSPSTLVGGSLTIRGGGVQLSDGSAEPLMLGFEADASLGIDTNPSTFDATLRLAGAIEALRCHGSYQPDRDEQLQASLEVSGVHGAQLSRFLPSGLACDLDDGALSGTVSLSVGDGLDLRVTGLHVSDRGTELGAIDRVDLRVDELTADRVHIENLTVGGVRAMVTRTADGMHAIGFVLGSSAPSAATATPPARVAAEATAAPMTAPRGPLRLPVVSIDTLSLAFERLVVRERLAADGEPLLLTGRLSLLEPWRPDPEDSRPHPARFQLTATADPICASVQADVVVQAYELAPTIEVDLRVSGIDTTALPRVLPSLREHLQGQSTAAELTARLHARLDLKRRDPRQFEPDRAFGGELTIDELLLRDTTDDSSLLAVESIDVRARAIDPVTGDVLLRSIEIDSPKLQVRQTPAGTEMLGMLLLEPPPPETPIAAPAAAVAATPAPAEFTVDHFELQGLNLDYANTTTTPATLLPIAALDLQVLRFTTRAFTEPAPFQFQMSMQGDSIALDRRVVPSSAVTGLLGSAARALTMQSTPEVESRSWLDTLQLTGELQLSPEPKGRVRASVAALELPALRGLARNGGVEIGDGLFDLTLAVDLRAFDGTDISSLSVFTWLSLSEPPGGPISTYLKLPAPLDSVLFLLKNDSDEHRLPLHVNVPTRGLGGGVVADKLAEALTRMISTAVASAGPRALSSVTGALGLSGGTTPLPVASQDFAVGDPLPGSGDLTAIVQSLTDDDTMHAVLTHELGVGDLDRAAALSTPATPVVRAFIDRLRADRRALGQQRDTLAAETAALYETGQMSEARWSQARLAELDQRLGELERTLDEALTMLGGDSAQAARRRTRNAALALANARLDAVQDQLLRQVPGLTVERLQRRLPRSAVTAGLDAGGRVVVAVSRRAQ